MPVIGHLRARPRLMIALGCAVIVGCGIPHDWLTYPVTRWLLAWNTLTVLYAVMAGVMMSRSTSHQMCRRARLQDDGQVIILAIVAFSAVASLAAIAGELAVVKDLHGADRLQMLRSPRRPCGASAHCTASSPTCSTLSCWRC